MHAIVAYLHHVLVHFPIALGLLAAVMAVVNRRRGTDSIDRHWRIVLQAVAGATVLAVVAGLLAAPHAEEAGLPLDKLFWHRLFGIAAGVSFVLAAIFVTFERLRRVRRAMTLARVLTVVGAVSAGFAGHIGGDMLHPGLAPWSREPHMHTLAIPSPTSAPDRGELPGSGATTPSAPDSEPKGHQHSHGEHGH